MFRIGIDRDSMTEMSARKRDRLAVASETDLRYGYFEANLHLSVEGFEEEFPVTPLVDFMCCLLSSARS